MTTTRTTAHEGDGAPRRVLHVVEKFSSGVGSAIAQYSRSLPSAEHFLLSTTAVDAEGDLADQAAFAGTYRMAGPVPAKIRRIRAVAAELRPDVVHAHSSHGGAYTRLALRRRRQPIVYTPHCYAFERRDVARPTRAAFWGIEALLARNTTVFAACAPREERLSRWPGSGARRVLVPNVAPVPAHLAQRTPGEPPVVVGGGRISPQKDPGYFAAVVAELRRARPELRAVWLGDGEPDARRALERAEVEVTGWLPRAAVLDRLAAADLYLHSARWEGFPLMVAEAVALGVPTLVRPVPSFDDVPGELRPADPVAAALTCLADPAANVERWRALLSGNTVESQSRALAEAYAAAVVPDSHPIGGGSR
ncbi:glycosyltransferase family 4 protein [Blastococcus sp. TF02-8]|uniref:glycosyltransferase family 4 protein n=1 Tax=Blastococcus sp. TF02-8 TaxID=2250574 RepID=UPI0014122B0C|nr:glycosyltransferase family 4 protein [Blastococcus sp. TF02-8]